MVEIRFLTVVTVAFSLVSLSAGCGSRDGLKRVVVSGQVTLNGAPIEDGQIKFIPAKGTEGPATIGPIRQGTYECKRNGGVPQGEHRIEILAWDPDSPQPEGPGQPPRPQLVPRTYNKDSHLTASLDGKATSIVKNFELLKGP